jgi:hypothetical protein
METKREQIQEHMPLIGYRNHDGKYAECDYCTHDATYFHFAVSGYKGAVDRDAYACNAHVYLLNPFEGK